jgi:hypothetical protein
VGKEDEAPSSLTLITSTYSNTTCSSEDTFLLVKQIISLPSSEGSSYTFKYEDIFFSITENGVDRIKCDKAIKPFVEYSVLYDFFLC